MAALEALERDFGCGKKMNCYLNNTLSTRSYSYFRIHPDRQVRTPKHFKTRMGRVTIRGSRRQVIKPFIITSPGILILPFLRSRALFSSQKSRRIGLMNGTKQKTKTGMTADKLIGFQGTKNNKIHQFS